MPALRVARVVNAIQGFLDEHSFRRQVPQIYVAPLGHDVDAWLGLNLGSGSLGLAGVAVNPVIGVRHVGIESRYASWSSGAEVPDWVKARSTAKQGHPGATLAVPLGYLLPDARARLWEFDREGREVTPDPLLEAALEDYAWPFMRAHSELATIAMGLDGWRHAMREEVLARRAIACLMLGDREGAVAATSALEDRVSRMVGLAVPRYRAVAEGLRAQLGG